MKRTDKVQLTRRQFFKASTLGAGALALPALGLASVAAAPAQAAQAAAEQPLGPAIPQPTFNPIASTTTFGPLTDISMGWDGTLWGIDAQGAPHVYDSINDAWAPHGDGIDAAAVTPDGNTLYFFKSNEVISINLTTMQVSTPQALGNLWPNLPDSFKLGVSGACTGPGNGSSIILFNGGRYVSTDGAIPLSKLTAIPNWPQTTNWQDGLYDFIYSPFIGSSKTVLVRNGEFVEIDLGQGSFEYGPAPFSQTNAGQSLPASWGGKMDCGITFVSGNTSANWFFHGTARLFVNLDGGAPQLQYISNAIPNWPATWHPVLRHAPNGRDGNLWSVLPQSQGGWTVQHNGDSWVQLPNQADHVGVGQDNTVMLASAQRLWKFTGAYDGTGFTPLTPPSNLIQVSLGNANAVYARDANNNVYSFDPTSGALTQNTDVSANGGATHIAVTSDGSLWHAKPNNPNMNRQLIGSGAASQSIPVKQNLVATVSKVAGTDFGTAHCLATDTQGNTQAYRYDSPYVFKSAARYNASTASGVPLQVEQGVGLLFVIDGNQVDDNPFIYTTRVVTVDAHTGIEVASTPLLPQPMCYTQPVFDPLNNLVYVTTYNAPDATNNTTPGQLLALDPRTLTVKWSFTAPASMDAAALLTGARLFVSDRMGKLYMFDTTAALANPANVQPQWTVNVTTHVPPTTASTYRIAQPVYVPVSAPEYPSDLIYTAVWLYDYSGGRGAENTSGYWMSVWVGDGSINDAPQGLFRSADPNFDYTLLVTAPARGTLSIGSDRAPNYSPAVYYNCYDRVIAVGGGPTLKTFLLPTGDWISTAFTYDDGRTTAPSLTSTGTPPGAGWLWFGTNTGLLYSLDTNLKPVNYTPASVAPPNQSYFYTTPTLYKDAQGNVTVFFNANSADSNAIPSLYGFSPTNGNIAALPTGATTIFALSKQVTNGVIYAAGGTENNTATASQFPQIFGIRVDALAQDERDFIIESQLMQDPQDPGGTGGSTITAPDGNVIPNSVARYQTHLTVVDDKKHPQPNEPVKIWADVAGTVITVDGAQYTIGPDDAAFASVKTGVDGSLVIMSDATDINTSALRVWAGFMDPFERIVVYPDHEWHGRAGQSNANGTVADPNKPNLNTAYSYKPDPNNASAPKPLFTSDEKTQGTPTNVANAVRQMNTGLNPGGNSAASVAGALKTLHGSNPIAPYVAYTTLGGMHYGPNNARAKRTAIVAAPFGFALSKPAGGAHTYTPLSHSDARSAIDALTGKPWDPNNPNGTAAASNARPQTFVIRRSENIFTDFWNWLTNAINKAVSAIENVIVSVADDIMVGINFIVNGVEQAFKAIIKVVEDVVNAIGSFFVQLAKLIEEVIEALCVLFHFGEIIWTHNWLKGLINHEVNGLKDALTKNVKPLFDSFIQSGEDAIKAQFDEWRTQIGGQSFNDQPGAQSSTHSTFQVKDSTGATSSQSVVAGANGQKLKSNLPAGKESTIRAADTADTAGGAPSSVKSAHDAIGDFVSTFINRITGDGDLSAAFTQLQSDFSNLFSAQSGSQFLSSAVTVLLDLLETVLIGLLSVAGAFIDGLFGVIDDLITAVLGFMNTPLDIPFFSWLYKLLFGSDLTILDLVTLVASIPGTMIFMVVQGNYPSQAGLPDPTNLPNGSTATTSATSAQRAGFRPQATQATSSGVQLLLGVVNGLCIIFGVTACSTASDVLDDPPSWVGKAGFSLSIVVTALSLPLIYNDPSNVYRFDWSSYGVSAFIALAGGLGLFIESPATSKILSMVLSSDSACCLAFIIYSYIDDPKGTTAVYAFIGNIFSALPGLFNPLKYLGPIPKGVVIFFDIVGNVVWGVMTTVAALNNVKTAVRQRRLYFPWVSFNPVPQAQPRMLALGR